MKKRALQRERDEDSYTPTREDDQRSYSDRDYQVDYDMDMLYSCATYMDPKSIPPGYKYMWIRHAILGEPDNANWANYMRKGWKPVPADRHPEKVGVDTFKRLSEMKDFLHVGDVVCCERTLEECKREEEHYDRKNAKIIDSISQQLVMNGGSSIPSRVINERSFSHGQDLGGHKVF